MSFYKRKILPINVEVGRELAKTNVGTVVGDALGTTREGLDTYQKERYTDSVKDVLAGNDLNALAALDETKLTKDALAAKNRQMQNVRYHKDFALKEATDKRMQAKADREQKMYEDMQKQVGLAKDWSKLVQAPTTDRALATTLANDDNKKITELAEKAAAEGRILTEEDVRGVLGKNAGRRALTDVFAQMTPSTRNTVETLETKKRTQEAANRLISILAQKPSLERDKQAKRLFEQAGQDPYVDAVALKQLLPKPREAKAPASKVQEFNRLVQSYMNEGVNRRAAEAKARSVLYKDKKGEGGGELFTAPVEKKLEDASSNWLLDTLSPFGTDSNLEAKAKMKNTVEKVAKLTGMGQKETEQLLNDSLTTSTLSLFGLDFGRGGFDKSAIDQRYKGKVMFNGRTPISLGGLVNKIVEEPDRYGILNIGGKSIAIDLESPEGKKYLKENPAVAVQLGVKISEDRPTKVNKKKQRTSVLPKPFSTARMSGEGVSSLPAGLKSNDPQYLYGIVTSPSILYGQSQKEAAKEQLLEQALLNPRTVMKYPRVKQWLSEQELSK